MLMCRVCGSNFFEASLLHFENMPKGAQYFPDAQSVSQDRGDELTVWQCSGCGLVQLSNTEVSYYREVIRSAAFSEIVCNDKAKQFANFIQNYSLYGKKIVEIGCGRGEFISILRTFKVDAYGLEYAEASVEQCLKNGLNVTKGYIDNDAFILANAPFDAFLLLMFLEHMPNPNMALRGIRNNLADGAVGLVEVPNFDMMLRNKLFSEFICDHLLYFTADTLRTTLNLNGFDVIECEETRDAYVISAVVRKRPSIDFSGFIHYQTKIQAEIEEYVGRFSEKKVAIWGAGHQALASIALAKIQGKIRYVVDSAPFKQGKYTPATHLPIVAPCILNIDPVEAVIVMAASYSDEVAGILRQMFDENIQIAILRDYGLEKVQ